MASNGFVVVVSILLSCFVATSYAGVLFSTLKDHQNLLVQTPNVVVPEGQDLIVLKAGEDTIDLQWTLSPNVTAETTASYTTVTAKLCYAKVSQVDRGWRKTVDNLKKDKTCQFKVFDGEYTASKNHTYTVKRDIPTGTYFVRAYVYDSTGAEVAYGQSTNADKLTGLFKIQAISGRHTSLDICSVVFSAFSVLSLFGFFFMEKRQAKRK